jgi:hypothetical protein
MNKLLLTLFLLIAAVISMDMNEYDSNDDEYDKDTDQEEKIKNIQNDKIEITGIQFCSDKECAKPLPQNQQFKTGNFNLQEITPYDDNKMKMYLICDSENELKLILLRRDTQEILRFDLFHVANDSSLGVSGYNLLEIANEGIFVKMTWSGACTNKTNIEKRISDQTTIFSEEEVYKKFNEEFEAIDDQKNKEIKDFKIEYFADDECQKPAATDYKKPLTKTQYNLQELVVDDGLVYLKCVEENELIGIKLNFDESKIPVAPVLELNLENENCKPIPDGEHHMKVNWTGACTTANHDQRKVPNVTDDKDKGVQVWNIEDVVSNYFAEFLAGYEYYSNAFPNLVDSNGNRIELKLIIDMGSTTDLKNKTNNVGSNFSG